MWYLSRGKSADVSIQKTGKRDQRTGAADGRKIKSASVDTCIGQLPISEWKQEYADLKAQRDTDYTKLKAARAEVAELQKIRKCVDIALKAEQPEQTQNRTKRQEQER